jgi:serine O-acetyltransferase
VSTKRPFIKTLRRDYERHGRSLKAPELWVIAVYRYGEWSRDHSGVVGKVTGKVYGALNLGIYLTTGCSVHREVKVGDDLHIIHTGNIRIHPETVIGHRVGIMHDVTIGTNPDRPGAPNIGDDVFIGTGAKILGGVTIGNGARIAANSLVIHDVPAGATAVGVPARVLRYTGRPESEAPPPSPTERRET